MTVLTLDFTKRPELVPDRKLDNLLAEKVMGWTMWQDDWYLQDGHEWKFRHIRLFAPTANPIASQQIWIKCLEKAREMGYEVVMELDDRNRVHINGHHPVAMRLLVIDAEINHAICRFAAKLFGIEPT